MLNKLNKNFDSNIKKIKKLKMQLTFTIFLLLIILVIGIFIFLPVSWKKIAIAVTGNYNRTSPVGDQLNMSDWNLLDEDFLDKQSSSGDTMAGPLNMSGNNITNLGNPSSDDEAVNQGTMNTAISNAISAIPDSVSDIKDTDGNELRMVCGVSPTGGWLDYGGNAVQTVVDTSSAGFINNDIKYIVSLSGSNAGVTIGTDTLYNITNNSFELHISYAGWNFVIPGITGADANSWNWQVHWCGIGE